jgi:putative transposase
MQVYRRTRIAAYIIDETQVHIGHNEAWLWVAIEPVHRTVLGVYVSRHRNMLVAETFLRSLVRLYGRHTVYSDGGTWYPEACRTLGLEHRLHFSYEKSIIERTIEYFKDRMECFDDYYPCIKHGVCNKSHVYSWMRLFVFMCNNRKYNFDTLCYMIGDGG